MDFGRFPSSMEHHGGTLHRQDEPQTCRRDSADAEHGPHELPVVPAPLWADYTNYRTVIGLAGSVRLTLKVRRCHDRECGRFHRAYRPESEGRFALLGTPRRPGEPHAAHGCRADDLRADGDQPPGPLRRTPGRLAGRQPSAQGPAPPYWPTLKSSAARACAAPRRPCRAPARRPANTPRPSATSWRYRGATGWGRSTVTTVPTCPGRMTTWSDSSAATALAS
jgi:hypothetical protein